MKEINWHLSFSAMAFLSLSSGQVNHARPLTFNIKQLTIVKKDKKYMRLDLGVIKIAPKKSIPQGLIISRLFLKTIMHILSFKLFHVKSSSLRTQF